VIGGIEGPAAGTLTEEYGHLAERAGPAYRRTSARGDLPGQHIGKGIAGFAAQEPGSQQRVGFFRQPRHDERPAGE